MDLLPRRRKPALLRHTSDRPPIAPTHLSATTSLRQSVRINWAKVPGATNYAVSRAQLPARAFSRIALTTGTSLVDTDRSAGPQRPLRSRRSQQCGHKVASAHPPSASVAKAPGLALERPVRVDIYLGQKHVGVLRQARLRQISAGTSGTTSATWGSRGITMSSTRRRASAPSTTYATGVADPLGLPPPVPWLNKTGICDP